jgi:nucleosome binding factor SPN SPT16 subunit
MVIVFKDFGRPVQHVNTIPVESLDAVKDWLDSCEIPFYQGNLNLQWTTIIKTIQADPHDFFEQGGWNFLSTDSDDEDGGDESDEESAFEMEEDDFGSEPSSDEESDFDENASQDADEDDMSEVSEAPSWDELEASAARKDKNGGHDDEEEEKKSARKRKR